MEAVVRAVAHLPEEVLPTGTMLIREGTEQNAIYVLIEGAVAVLKGDVRVARIRTPGALFGEMAILLNLPASASVVAEEEVRVKIVANGEAFLAASPDVVLHTARLLAQRLHDSTAYLADVKAQFQDRSDHFGMVDKIIGALQNQQTEGPVAATDRNDDPRL